MGDRVIIRGVRKYSL